MTPGEKTRWLQAQARAEGFDLCGVAPVEGLADLGHVAEWIASGYAGEMKYLYDERRGDPRLVLEGARSLIVVALNYNTARPRTFAAQAANRASDGSPRGWISRYAWGDDYHDVLRERLNRIVDAMRAEFAEPFDARAYVDTGPIVERVAAKHAGLGWLAKNTCLINQQLGSWLFLGVIITTLELEYSLAPGEAPPRDLCGKCTRCLDACPTNAFPQPSVLDSRRCISYLTIELREAIPEELRGALGSATIGCDICQDVCPWNRKAPATAMAAFQPRRFDGTDSQVDDEQAEKSLFEPQLEWLASLTQEEFSRIFRKSAAKRAKWRGLVRNACVALGNAALAEGSPSRERVLRLLRNLAASNDGLIAEHANWALERQMARASRGTVG
ncbi:MAG TPA: tRNA epoxyqueuosine(34) reductase QueG [Candidatus Acidoferrales bacterium]|nr:tRNA epoxyqueuosine(34) reductase QueG [Candidatus Acidoferrales bacterium]